MRSRKHRKSEAQFQTAKELDLFDALQLLERRSWTTECTFWFRKNSVIR